MLGRHGWTARAGFMFGVVWGTVAGGCTQEAKPQACVVHADCGSDQACIDGQCGATQCYTSDDCARGAFCSASYQCVPGCETNIDCPTGETCDAGTCAPFTCRQTALDCDYGEVCQDGACFDHGGGACDVCDPATDGYCFPLYEGGACGADDRCPSGQQCYVADYTRDAVCGSDAECAAGYTCEEITFSDGSTSGPHCTRSACFAGAIYPPCVPSEGNTCGRGFQCFDLGGDQGVCFGDCEWLVGEGHL